MYHDGIGRYAYFPGCAACLEVPACIPKFFSANVEVPVCSKCYLLIVTNCHWHKLRASYYQREVFQWQQYDLYHMSLRKAVGPIFKLQRELLNDAI